MIFYLADWALADFTAILEITLSRSQLKAVSRECFLGFHFPPWTPSYIPQPPIQLSTEVGQQGWHRCTPALVGRTRVYLGEVEQQCTVRDRGYGPWKDSSTDRKKSCRILSNLLCLL